MKMLTNAPIFWNEGSNNFRKTEGEKKYVIKGITKVHEKLFEFKNYQTISQIS
jgi:hypothetical protein